jgi:hypothetical protein
MNIAMEQTEVRGAAGRRLHRAGLAADAAARSFRPRPAARSPPPPPHRRRRRRPRPQEFVDGQLKNKYGDAFIRGNNVLYISNVGEAGTK